MTNPPAWLTEKGVTVYAIPKGIIVEGRIYYGRLQWKSEAGDYYNVAVDDERESVAWREAWERLTQRKIRFPNGVEQDATAFVPDSHVWLVRQACPSCRGMHDPGMLQVPSVNACDTCKRTGHVHVLVRVDAEPVKWHLYWDANAERTSEAVVVCANIVIPELGVAGLRAIRPERKCDYFSKGDDGSEFGDQCFDGRKVHPYSSGNEDRGLCPECKGTGTLERKTFDVWRDKTAGERGNRQSSARHTPDKRKDG